MPGKEADTSSLSCGSFSMLNSITDFRGSRGPSDSEPLWPGRGNHTSQPAGDGGRRSSSEADSTQPRGRRRSLTRVAGQQLPVGGSDGGVNGHVEAGVGPEASADRLSRSTPTPPART
ncbi:hypothetical protein EYF80_052400 [Liparis tanakae]|uniref:Uncharacterized protein n=1 Tax=Liparis tanakae TaxID=230148 RepID=A0A4Z2F8G2_9TELE|nr:hypothetical protein EYF80_052400 [Liparis tanakae]